MSSCKVDNVNDVAVVILEDIVQAGPDQEQLESRLKEMIASGQRKFVCDLEHVIPNMSLLGTLARLHTSVPGQVHLCKNKRIKELLRVTRLHLILRYYDSREDALKALQDP